MAAQHDVEVLTTCARDYITWANEYPEGSERINGVTVRRFPNAHTRDIDAFNRYSEWIFHNPHTRDDEMSWLEQQGPWCPALLDRPCRTRGSPTTRSIFFTYLYAPTVLGLQIAAERSILAPTAHNEPAIHLGIYTGDVQAAQRRSRSTPRSRRRFSRRRSTSTPSPKKRSDAASIFSPATRTPRVPAETACPKDRSSCTAAASTPARAATSCSIFSRRTRQQGGPATLVLMGAKLMPLPNVPWVRYAGLLSEADRLRALEAATIVVVPSPFESLSLLALEGMAVGNPVLCNAHADVLVDHCRRSNAGLFYSTREEFVECIAPAARRPRSARADGTQRQSVRHRQLCVERDHGQVRQADRSASEGMNTTLVRRVVFAAIFLITFGIYVMRASTSGALREPPETGDGHDYDAIAFNVWQGRGFGYEWSDENWRKPYEGIPRYRLLLTRRVGVLSHHLSAAGDAAISSRRSMRSRAEASPRGASSIAASRPAPSRRPRSSPRSLPECRPR